MKIYIERKCIFYFRVVFHLNFTTLKLAFHFGKLCVPCPLSSALPRPTLPPSPTPPPLACVFIIMAHHGPLIYVNFHCQFSVSTLTAIIAVVVAWDPGILCVLYSYL